MTELEARLRELLEEERESVWCRMADAMRLSRGRQKRGLLERLAQARVVREMRGEKKDLKGRA